MRHLYTLLLLCCITIPLWSQTPNLPKQVEVKTNKGSFIIELFDDTPIHRDHFLELVREHAYDNVIFQRIVKNFMVQAGGNVRNGNTETALDLKKKYNTLLQPEFRYPKHLHKRGALSAARLGDEENPKKLSDGFQFFIVTGTFFLPDELDDMAQTLGYQMPDSVKQVYMNEGGAPHLDKNYTVFGQVISGYKTIEKIKRVKVNENNKPYKDVYIESMKLITPKKKS